MIPWLGDNPDADFPPVARALDRPNGLLAAGGDLSVIRLLRAYRSGIFPWYSEGQPVLWWSPDPRCVLPTSEIHVSRRTARRLRQGGYAVTMDRAFPEVIAACAEPRDYEPDTWITSAMNRAYRRLHEAGWAHSLEVWRGGSLIGGIYGVAIGRMFFGESMFRRETDASKIALIALCRQLSAWDFPLLDCQVHSPHLDRMGAWLIERPTFIQEVSVLADRSGIPAPWHFEMETSELA